MIHRVVVAALMALVLVAGGVEAQPVVPVQGVQGGMPVSIQGTVATRQATTGAVLADLVVTTASQQLVGAAPGRIAIICWNQGASPNAIRVGFGATPTSTSGYFLPWGAGFTDTGTYAINVIRDTGATAGPTLSCSTVSQ